MKINPVSCDEPDSTSPEALILIEGFFVDWNGNPTKKENHPSDSDIDDLANDPAWNHPLGREIIAGIRKRIAASKED